MPFVKVNGKFELKRIVFAMWWNSPVHAFSFKDVTLGKKTERIDDKEVKLLSLKSKGQGVFGDHFISLTCELPVVGAYRISLNAVKEPAQGKVQLFMDEAPDGPVADFCVEKRQPAPGVDLGTLELDEGPNNLMFKVVDKNEKSQGRAFDVTNVIYEKIEYPRVIKLRLVCSIVELVTYKENELWS